MAGKHKYEYPPDDELRKLCAEFGYTEVARQLEIPASTLQNYLRRRKIPATKQKQATARPDLADLPPQPSEAEILQARVKELEKQLRRDRKEHVYDERVTRAVTDAIQKAEPKYSPSVIPTSTCWSTTPARYPQEVCSRSMRRAGARAGTARCSPTSTRADCSTD